MLDLAGQQALVNRPEKSLLVLVYLQAGDGTENFINGLRLQNLDRLNPDQLMKQAGLFGTPEMLSAVKIIAHSMQSAKKEFEKL